MHERTIQLTSKRPDGEYYIALVSERDYNLVKDTRWRARKNRNGSVYAQGRPNKGPSVLLHRFILGLKASDPEVDHRDRNGLNCCRENLRLATRSQQMANQDRRRNNKSGFKGVSQNSKNSWYVSYRHNGIKHYIGPFQTPIAAAQAYDDAMQAAFGEFATTNRSLGLLPVQVEKNTGRIVGHDFLNL